jgi:retron-type reverse transcriptase
MGTYKNLYEKLCSYDNLLLAFKKAKKRKSRKGYVIKFESNLENELKQLQIELISSTYGPRPLKTFIVRDPKTRKISASNFRDRVVHHALCNVIEPIFEKIFIYDSYANRKGKGTLAALKRFDEFKRKISHNGRLVKNSVDNPRVRSYVLKADIKHYFDTVDHEILIRILRKKIADERVIQLIKRILTNHKTKILGKGMPLGNLTSQFFANIYLNELDYFVKHNLKAKYYLRYVDDFVILHPSKEVLEDYKEKVNQFLEEDLKIELHPEKSKIIPLAQGVGLLGFRVFYYHKLMKKSNILKMKRKVELFKMQYRIAQISLDQIKHSFNGWSGYAMQGNTYKLRKEIAEELPISKTQ